MSQFNNRELDKTVSDLVSEIQTVDGRILSAEQGGVDGPRVISTLKMRLYRGKLEEALWVLYSGAGER